MLASLHAIDSLVVRCPNWVGDIVMATPVFECLRNNFPDATITACVRPYARGILEDSPWFDHIVDCQDKNFFGMKKIRAALKPLNPQAGLLLTNTTHSFITFKLAGIPDIYGYRRNLRKYFLTGGPEPKREKKTGKKIKALPMQDYYLELCRYLQLELPEKPKAKLYISEQLAAKGRARLDSYGIQAQDMVIGLNPGASFGSSKCWPGEHFARLAELLQAQYRCKLLLLVGPGEEAIANAIVSQSKAEIVDTSADKIDLAELKPLIQRCDLLITNDTGPRHYAVAFDVPNIVLMGPTNPLYTATSLQHTTVLQRDLPCVPCHKKTCPLGHHRCMTEITPEMVLHETNLILGEGEF
ncbi:MAG: lipopolysaccharide heptosyltransferase II [Pseudohongiella sp.]|nr:lipopolysaccharide heptosyltransferase II [Pseudohongiella sp.]